MVHAVKESILTQNPDFVGRIVDVEETMLFLRAWFMGRKMNESLRALSYMKMHHQGQRRTDG